MYKVYKLTFSSGKSYIGQTSRKMITRITQHRQAARTGSLLAVHCAWRAYGEPDVLVLKEVITQEELHAAEIAAIANFNTMSPSGYNLSIGGDTAPSKNPKVAAKIAAKAIGRKHSEETIASMSDNSKKAWECEEYRIKVSDGLKAAWTDEMRQAAGERAKARWEKRKADGWTVKESTTAKLRGRIFSDETKAKMSAASKGKKKAPRSAETCKKLSKSVSKSWTDPEIKKSRSQAISNALKEKHANMSEAEKQEFNQQRRNAWITRKSKSV